LPEAMRERRIEGASGATLAAAMIRRFIAP
jgi:hypothetical protein